MAYAGNMRRPFVLLALVAGTCAQAQQAQRVETAAAKYLTENKVTGASVAISVDGTIKFQKGFGFADLENKVPAKLETVFRLASISKVVTATAVMQLVEQGKIDLDKDIRTYVPEFPDKGKVVTVRHLLTHTSGVRHYKLGEVDNTKPFATVSASLNRFIEDPLLHSPGEKETYSTYAFNLLARAVETQSNKSFRDYLNGNVFEKAGMASSGLEVQSELVPNRARGYRLAGGKVLNCEFADISYKWAGGGMISTAPDLCRFGSALLSGALLKPATFASMMEPQKLADGKSMVSRGLAWALGTYRGSKGVAHGGAQQGTKTYLMVLPGSKTVIAVLTNFETHNPGELANVVRDAWFGPAKSSEIH